jgi:dienelactone hydrolase
MMKRMVAVGALTLLFSYFYVPSCAAQSSLEGDWRGGLDFGSSWQSINLHFKPEQQGVVGTIDFPEQGRMGLALNRIAVESSHVHIEWQGESGLAIFDGQLKDGTISGEFRQGESKATFGLVRVANIDPKIYDQYAGSYRLGSERFIYVGVNNANELRFADSKTRRIGTLYPSTESTFFLGSTVDIPYPIEGRVAFVRNNRGEVSGLTWNENGTRIISARKLPHRQEPATFRNAEATLTGTLLLPPTKGPHPAVVIVNPGYSFPRRNSYVPYFFTQQGIAVLTLNGRSVGGKPADYQHSSFEERARDALAGVGFLKGRADINPKRIGLHGASLSSWVVPLASTLSPDVAFIILRVGSAIPTAENILYEIENDLRERNFSEDDIAKAAALRRLANTTILSNTGWDALKAEIEKAKNEKWFGYARVGWMLSLSLPPDAATLKGLQDPISYDPVPILEKVTVPVLAFNAELDRSVNTKVSVPIMERALRKAGNKDFTIVVLPRASHDLMEAETGYNSEWVRLKRQTPGYWDTMAAWLRKRTGVKNEPI